MVNGQSTKHSSVIKTYPSDTDFGTFTDVEEHSYKEFFFNLGVRRKFINAFIINLVPLFAVALLLFAQLLTVSVKEDLIDRFGFNMRDTIAAYSAMFFIILLAHIQVRSQFADSGLVYIEYFYLIMYLTILFSAMNLYVFSLGNLRYLNVVHYQDNLIAKVAYWPIIGVRGFFRSHLLIIIGVYALTMSLCAYN